MTKEEILDSQFDVGKRSIISVKGFLNSVNVAFFIIIKKERLWVKFFLTIRVKTSSVHGTMLTYQRDPLTFKTSSMRSLEFRGTISNGS